MEVYDDELSSENRIMMIKRCDAYLTSIVGVGWNDLSDTTVIDDFVTDGFDFDNDDMVECIVKDICWDKLDLDGTIYKAMSREQLNELIYGEG